MKYTRNSVDFATLAQFLMDHFPGVPPRDMFTALLANTVHVGRAMGMSKDLILHVVDMGWDWTEDTIAAGAHVRDGKLCDANGKEISDEAVRKDYDARMKGQRDDAN